MAEPIQVNISQAGLNSLRQMVGSPGWAKSIENIVLGGKILNDIPETSPLDPKLTGEPLRQWADTPVSFALPEKLRDVCKIALRHFANEGAVPPNKNTAQLYIEFGLS